MGVPETKGWPVQGGGRQSSSTATPRTGRNTPSGRVCPRQGSPHFRVELRDPPAMGTTSLRFCGGRDPRLPMNVTHSPEVKI